MTAEEATQRTLALFAEFASEGIYVWHHWDQSLVFDIGRQGSPGFDPEKSASIAYMDQTETWIAE